MYTSTIQHPSPKTASASENDRISGSTSDQSQPLPTLHKVTSWEPFDRYQAPMRISGQQRTLSNDAHTSRARTSTQIQLPDLDKRFTIIPSHDDDAKNVQQPTPAAATTGPMDGEEKSRRIQLWLETLETAPENEGPGDKKDFESEGSVSPLSLTPSDSLASRAASRTQHISRHPGPNASNEKNSSRPSVRLESSPTTRSMQNSRVQETTGSSIALRTRRSRRRGLCIMNPSP